MAKIISVNISEKKGTVKKPVEAGRFELDLGLVGDAHSGSWHRMVSLLAEESIDKVRKLGMPELKPGDFAENLTTEGLILHELPIGSKLRIGQTLMEVTQIGKECHLGCEIRNKVGDCVMPREGIFCRVLEAGDIKAGDAITVEAEGLRAL
ncbi:MOSC domain-containing protein [Acidaminobacter hydrogenoformans]|uniref:MOSC domain-containing protein YiiM n=1 Tax=Acidaminobacter hydrogenoformans DSM 2784 TaxID=1120920 RepID=A0A1G5S0P7_9FIRM|nr:MOSC domain-containing protein [Acidaminobacter hydrogenoformans]SCZ79934.1 MOSC domain-containing protein YiiM [Acidaminobacter hydrogenoformans DSM 2784]